MPRIANILILSLIFSVAAFSQSKQPKACVIKGRVLDDSNKPLPKAEVVVDAPPRGWEDLIINDSSDSQGRFNYRLDYCPFPESSRTLFVTTTPSYEHYVPFHIPFLRSKIAGDKYAGQVIKNKTKSDLDVGDIKVQVTFTTVTIKFVDLEGNNLLSGKDWANVWFKIKTENGIWVSESGLSINNQKTAVQSKDSAILMDLPEGKWQIELSRSWGRKPWLKPDGIVNVERSASPFSLTLKMSKDQNPQRK